MGVFILIFKNQNYPTVRFKRKLQMAMKMRGKEEKGQNG